MIDILEELNKQQNVVSSQRTFKNPYKDIIDAYTVIEQECTDVDAILALTPQQLHKYQQEQIKAFTGNK